jgi:hypothetical protein
MSLHSNGCRYLIFKSVFKYIMKECCRTGDEKSPGKGQAWLKRLIYFIVFLVVAMVTYKQLIF